MTCPSSQEIAMKRFTKVLSTVVASLLASNAAALQVGDIAPDFEVQSTQGPLRLGDLVGKGPVVLAFYYLDFTPV
jgi:hypothetical protein